MLSEPTNDLAVAAVPKGTDGLDGECNLIRKKLVQIFNKLSQKSINGTCSIDEDLIEIAVLDPELEKTMCIDPDQMREPTAVYNSVIRKLTLFEAEDIEQIISVYLGGNTWNSWNLEARLKFIDECIKSKLCDDIKYSYANYGGYLISHEFDNLYDVELTENDEIYKIIIYPDRIAQRVLETLHVISYSEIIYVYKDGIYVQGKELVIAEITRIVNGIRKKRFSGSIKTITENIFHYVRYNNPRTTYPFNREPNAIPVNNGILILDFENHTKKLIPHSPEYVFNYKLPVDFDENADPTPTFNLISQWVPSHPEVLYQIPAQAIMQRLGFGPYKKFYLLQGPPDAGKSTYLDVLFTVFGKENKCDVSLDELSPSQNRFAASSLEGKLFNIHDDMTAFLMKDSGTIKRFTGAYEFEIEEKKEKRRRATITAVHIFACNFPPKYSKDLSGDTAFWERVEYTLFPNKFIKDPKFKQAMFTPRNLSGFFNQVIGICFRMYKQNKLIRSSSYSDVRELWTRCADIVYQFILEYMVPSKEPIYVTKDSFLDAIQAWGFTHGLEEEEVPSTTNALTKSLSLASVDPEARAENPYSGVETRCYALPWTWKNPQNPFAKRVIHLQKKCKKQPEPLQATV